MGSLSRVYFIATNETDSMKLLKAKLSRLLDESRLLDCIDKKDKVAIKMHFGEEGNIGYVRAEYVRVIYEAITKLKANAFVADTNTLYRGGRTNSQDHLKLAYAHGFTPDVVGAPLVIPDETQKDQVQEIVIKGKFIKVAKIAKIFWQAEAIVGVAHFKGHLMTGFGGALKNLGMGCATREGKLAQHCGLSPVVIIEKCIGCQACEEVCPVKAISIKNEKAHLDSSRCIGCASCIAACPQEAVDIQWEAGADTIQEKMVEYTSAVLKGKEKKRLFINFATRVTKDCDCLAKDEPPIAPDVGIFASFDPVSIDKASMDLINRACGKDIFKEAHPKRDGSKQLEYASRLGLGNLDYQLIKFS